MRNINFLSTANNLRSTAAASKNTAELAKNAHALEEKVGKFEEIFAAFKTRLAALCNDDEDRVDLDQLKAHINSIENDEKRAAKLWKRSHRK